MTASLFAYAWASRARESSHVKGRTPTAARAALWRSRAFCWSAVSPGTGAGEGDTGGEDDTGGGDGTAGEDGVGRTAEEGALDKDDMVEVVQVLENVEFADTVMFASVTMAVAVVLMRVVVVVTAGITTGMPTPEVGCKTTSPSNCPATLEARRTAERVALVENRILNGRV